MSFFLNNFVTVKALITCNNEQDFYDNFCRKKGDLIVSLYFQGCKEVILVPLVSRSFKKSLTIVCFYTTIYFEFKIKFIKSCGK